LHLVAAVVADALDVIAGRVKVPVAEVEAARYWIIAGNVGRITFRRRVRVVRHAPGAGTAGDHRDAPDPPRLRA
jgi:hypothetical protein